MIDCQFFKRPCHDLGNDCSKYSETEKGKNCGHNPGRVFGVAVGSGPCSSIWKGKRIEDLSREELIEAINWLARELEEQLSDKARWMKAADPIKYLMTVA